MLGIFPKLLLLFLVNLFLCSPIYGAYEDFTTYTEVDVGADRVSVDDSDTITVSNLDRDEEVYVYYDKGAGHFGTTFEHYVDSNLTGMGTNYSLGVFYGLANSVDDLSAATDALGVRFYKPADGNIEVQLFHHSGQDSFDRSGQVYVTVERTGDTTIEARVYSDAEKTTLLDTLSGTVTSGKSFRYIYPVSGWNTGRSGVSATYDVENLDLNEAAPAATSWFWVTD